jgi:hypothetical protein
MARQLFALWATRRAELAAPAYPIPKPLDAKSKIEAKIERGSDVHEQ